WARNWILQCQSGQRPTRPLLETDVLLPWCHHLSCSAFESHRGIKNAVGKLEMLRLWPQLRVQGSGGALMKTFIRTASTHSRDDRFCSQIAFETMRKVTFFCDSDHRSVVQFWRKTVTNARALRAQHPRQLPHLPDAGGVFILQPADGRAAQVE